MNLENICDLLQKTASQYLIPFWNGSRVKLAGLVILLYKKVNIWVQNSIYFYNYKHIELNLNGFIVQMLVETNDIDHLKSFIAVWFIHRLWKRPKNMASWHFFTKMRFSQNEIFALFKTVSHKISKTVDRNSMKFYTHVLHLLS